MAVADVVFFDLDGTLTDPKLGITRCIQHALAELGRPVPGADELTWCIGPPLRQSFAALVGESLAANAIGLYRQRFSAVGWRENVVYPRIVDTLTGLMAAGIELHVATSKPHVYADQIIEHFGLSTFFRSVYGSELDGTHADKAELLKHALNETGGTGEIVMIGDRIHDAIAARANDVAFIGVTYGYGSTAELDEAGPWPRVDSPSALLPLLLPAPA